MDETLTPDLIRDLNQLVDRAITAVENNPNGEAEGKLFGPLSDLGYALDQLKASADA